MQIDRERGEKLNKSINSQASRLKRELGFAAPEMWDYKIHEAMSLMASDVIDIVFEPPPITKSP